MKVSNLLQNTIKIFEKDMKNTNLFSLLSSSSIVCNSMYVFINNLGKYSILDVGIEEKKNLLEKEIAELVSNNFKLHNEIVKYFANLKEILRSFKYIIIDVEINTKTRTLVGVSTSLGRLIFDSGISFDPYMNLPYIPASEIKGIVRSYIEDKLGEKEAEEIFGNEEREGNVNFTDAYPVKAENFLFVPDVITPHYNEKKSEADAEPKPAIHLTIAPKVTFRFLIYYKREDVGKPICESLPLVIIRGLGARSSVGYSLFELSKIEVIR
ncbi:type III-B CRISPR module RAMP protein Cmr6 [Saccharolobus islandicus]|uniref:type III-B CRISPR module RAMP protein Cmr6 n=1 Tax=Saccharolobus islandicus TaxID=43080 RepID=UPI0004943BF6|nr:type III-B CRISPR module RAMP protein Cmr6 [Sulfolobus islandicus]